MSAPLHRILYIDDDPGLCRLVQKGLERNGYVIEIATDGAQGVARIEQGGIDVVALDHFMPNQDGMQTLAQLRLLKSPPPVVYVTALQGVDVAVAALKAGAVDYVAKDTMGQFLPLLQKAIDMALDGVRLGRARDAAETEIKRTWLLTQGIVDTIRDALVVLEDDMTIVTANRAFLKLFGITEAQVRGRRISELGQHQWDVPALRHLMEKVLPESTTLEGFEIEDDFPGLGRRVFSLNARKIFRPGNNVHRLLLVFEDITERKQRERDAQTLTNEISHRIKNNLQLIVGLIAYESRKAAGPCVQGYKAMETRIGAIARLYDLISQSSRGGIITMDAYLREIAKTMSASLLGGASGITIEVAAEALDLDPDITVPFGLLVNELATNAIKHAFPGGTGRVLLGARNLGDRIELTVADNGIGMKDRSAAELTEKRGFNYVAIFVRQLGGTITTTGSEGTGTIVKVQFPPLLHPPGAAGEAAA
jgi:PAS domain S-box-containing protein